LNNDEEWDRISIGANFSSYYVKNNIVGNELKYSLEILIPWFLKHQSHQQIKTRGSSILLNINMRTIEKENTVPDK
jgi:hypothetical protein